MRTYGASFAIWDHMIKSGDIVFYCKTISELRSITLPYGTQWTVQHLQRCGPAILQEKTWEEQPQHRQEDHLGWVRYLQLLPSLPAVFDAREFVCKLCWQFFIDIWRFTCLTASSFWSYYEKFLYFRPIDLRRF